MSKRDRFEREYIELCLKHAKALHIGPRQAFSNTAAWAYKCSNRLREGRDIYTGIPIRRQKGKVQV